MEPLTLDFPMETIAEQLTVAEGVNVDYDPNT